jgi:hypothetical protein
MKTELSIQLSLLCVVAAACPVSQAQSVKPGLWEITNKMGGSPKMDDAMAKMEKQMAAMPPEQRKMMQDMMAKKGIGMGGQAQGGGTVVKICMSKEMADKQHFPSHSQGDCTTTVTDKTASSLKMSFICKSPPSSGEGVYTFVGDTAYTMRMKMNRDIKGTPETITMDADGKWIAADCGSIKPLAVPAK